MKKYLSLLLGSCLLAGCGIQTSAGAEREMKVSS